jgi:PAS domain S-box-containing protein
LAELNRLAEELTALNLLGRKVSASLSLEAVVASALETILGTVKCDLAFLFLREGERLVLAGIAPETGRELLGQIPEHRVGVCICGLAVRLGQPLYSRDIFTDVRCTLEECKKAGLHSFAALPLRQRDAIIGVLGLASRTERDFAPQAEFLEALAGTVAASLQNAKLFESTKRTQEALRTSEAHFRRTFDLSPVGAVIAGEDFRFLRCNEAFCRFLGYTESELQQKSFLEVTHPEDRQIGITEARAILADQMESARVQKRYLHRTGRTVWGDVSIRLVKDQEGNSLHLLVIVQDVTEQKRTEEALKESEAFRKRVFESSRNPIVVLDAETLQCVECNKAAVEIYHFPSREAMLGTTPADVSAAVQYDGTPSSEKALHYNQRARTNGAVIFEWRNQYPDGGLWDAEIHLMSFVSGGHQFFQLTSQNVTERKQAEQKQREFEAQMQQAQKLESLGILAGGIAHDFNNLLTAILGHANLALMDLAPESPARENLREIDKASSRAAELCRQMLAYAGKGRFVVESINLSRLVEELTRLLYVSISKKVLLRCQLAEGLPAIDADPAQLRQLAMNLVINAADAIGDADGIITISTGTMQCDEDSLRGGPLTAPPIPGRYVYLEVIDTGCGMDAKTQARIFDPFFTTKFAGRGLGLAAVLGIVRSHRGVLKVDSEPGRGTTFRVLFPASTKDAVPVQSDGNPPPWRGKGTILLVDDEEPVRNVSGRMLERSGFAVLRAGDGLEAIELFRAHAAEIVCVLLDLAMPRMDGEETFKELRRIQPDVRVILASGYSDQEISQRFQNLGLAGFIEKPYRVEALTAKLREVLAQQD